MRVEGYTLLSDFTKLCKRENLKSSGIGKYGLIPIKELMKSAHTVNKIVSGTYVKVVSI